MFFIRTVYQKKQEKSVGLSVVVITIALYALHNYKDIRHFLLCLKREKIPVGNSYIRNLFS